MHGAAPVTILLATAPPGQTSPRNSSTLITIAGAIALRPSFRVAELPVELESSREDQSVGVALRVLTVVVVEQVEEANEHLAVGA